jgi:cell division protein FtsB
MNEDINWKAILGIIFAPYGAYLVLDYITRKRDKVKRKQHIEERKEVLKTKIEELEDELEHINEIEGQEE